MKLPVGPNGRPYLPAEIDEMSLSSDEDDEEEDASTAAEGAVGEHDAVRDERESEEDATSETLVQEETSHALGYDLIAKFCVCKSDLLVSEIFVLKTLKLHLNLIK